jgi:hypothetical protein
MPLPPPTWDHSAGSRLAYARAAQEGVSPVGRAGIAGRAPLFQTSPEGSRED